MWLKAGEGLFRPSRPDFIETTQETRRVESWHTRLFRPSRPDFIETLFD